MSRSSQVFLYGTHLISLPFPNASSALILIILFLVSGSLARLGVWFAIGISIGALKRARFAAINSILDIVVFLLPVQLIRALSIPRGQKIALLIIFTCGSL